MLEPTSISLIAQTAAFAYAVFRPAQLGQRCPGSRCCLHAQPSALTRSAMARILVPQGPLSWPWEKITVVIRVFRLQCHTSSSICRTSSQSRSWPQRHVVTHTHGRHAPGTRVHHRLAVRLRSAHATRRNPWRDLPPARTRPRTSGNLAHALVCRDIDRLAPDSGSRIQQEIARPCVRTRRTETRQDSARCLPDGIRNFAEGKAVVRASRHVSLAM